MRRARSASVVLAVALMLLGSALRAQPGGADVHGVRVPDMNSPGLAQGDAASLAMLDALARPAAPHPRFDASVPPLVRFRLEEAYGLAVDAVRRQPTCSALFGQLGVMGDETLARTLYRAGGEVGACLRSVPAFTCVGCPQTVLCPTFTRLGPPAGATILIHEALHFAGLKERPTHPGAMSAPEITTMVEASCRL